MILRPWCLILLSLSALAGAAPRAGGEWTIERFRWQGPLGSTQTIEIRNDYGDIRTRSAGNQEVEISAVIQQQSVDPYTANILVGDRVGHMVIQVELTKSDGADEDEELRQRIRRRVDMTVFIPPGAELRARTLGGLIEARGLESNVIAESTSGDVFISTIGHARARSERGAITVHLRGAAWPEAPRFETVSGDVAVWLPPDADAVVEAETAGEITTDYSISIRPLGTGTRKHAVATIGNGRHQLFITSGIGKIKILRSVY